MGRLTSAQRIRARGRGPNLQSVNAFEAGIFRNTHVPPNITTPSSDCGGGYLHLHRHTDALHLTVRDLAASPPGMENKGVYAHSTSETLLSLVLIRMCIALLALPACGTRIQSPSLPDILQAKGRYRHIPLIFMAKSPTSRHPSHFSTPFDRKTTIHRLYTCPHPVQPVPPPTMSPEVL